MNPETLNRLSKALESVGIDNIGPDGEIQVAQDRQAEVATALEKAGFGMLVVSGMAPSDRPMYKIVAAPRSIKDIISQVVPENSESIAKRIKVDPVLRAVQMNMIAFD